METGPEPTTYMARGSKSSYTNKQKRKASHIEKGYEKRGVSKKEAEERAWRTVNKQSGGGKKSGSGRKKSTARKSSSRKSTTRRKSSSRKKK
jgi:plasmid stabilization system protein ParE